MFSSIKMEEYMESKLSGIFRVKLVTKNIVRGSPGTQFMHMRVNKQFSKEAGLHFSLDNSNRLQVTTNLHLVTKLQHKAKPEYKIYS